MIYILHSCCDILTNYIGSVYNAINRLSQHQDAIRVLLNNEKVHRPLLNIGETIDVMWGTVYSMINYSKLAVTPTYQFNQGEVIILRALTDFFLRIIEQSLITGF